MPYERPQTFDALFDAHRDRVYRFCRRLCGDADEAEDLAQEVFVRAFRGLDGFQGRCSVQTWLCRIALHRWQQLNAKRRLETVPLLEDRDGPPAADPAARVLVRLVLEEALAALPVALRETYLLVKVEGLKYREAAEVLGIPQGTVHSRVQEAGARLRAWLRDVSDGPDPPVACRRVPPKNGGD